MSPTSRLARTRAWCGLFNKCPEGYSPVLTDITRNVWIIRNPDNQTETKEILPHSAPTIEVVGGLHPYKAVKWSDVSG